MHKIHQCLGALKGMIKDDTKMCTPLQIQYETDYQGSFPKDISYRNFDF